MTHELFSRRLIFIIFFCGIIIACASLLVISLGPLYGYTGGQYGPAGGKIQITSRDIQNNTPLEGVNYYINGVFAGTSSSDGTLVISVADYATGIVTIQAEKEGYRDETVPADLSKNLPIFIDLHKSDVFPVLVNGPSTAKIDIVFVPSHTSFNSSTNKKVVFAEYPGGKSRFEADVRKFINQTFEAQPAIMAHVSSDYLKKFNFYYYWADGVSGDAFEGCAGSIPEDYWHEVTYSDLTILLYPAYYGMYLGPPSQPMGCTNPNGLGNVYLKIPADQPNLAMHEIGHGLYGLVDTYCGSTYYYQNNPDPNVWNSRDTCRSYATKQGWDPDNCRRIELNNGGCSKDFWRWDPDPDIMKEGYYGKFGDASSLRMLSIIDKY
ncbi:MAG: hypothetical protein WC342_08595 [Methanoregula sp.]|jgi:hypothetical protein